MAALIYPGIVSLDGYVADKNGNFDWGVPDEQVHTFVNNLERSIGTHLYGRGMYGVMSVWEMETMRTSTNRPAFIQDFARIWQAADKIVYSKTLKAVSGARTRIEREFDPAAIQKLKGTTERNITVGGPGLAATAIRAGLVDEIHLFVAPVVVGGGNKFLPSDVHLALALLDQRRFDNGTVFLRYEVGT